MPTSPALTKARSRFARAARDHLCFGAVLERPRGTKLVMALVVDSVLRGQFRKRARRRNQGKTVTSALYSASQSGQNAIVPTREHCAGNWSHNDEATSGHHIILAV